MQIESNVFFRFSIRFDSIWTPIWRRKKLKIWQERWKIKKKGSQLILPVISGIVAIRPLKIGQFHNGNIFFITADKNKFSIESNRILNRIDIESKSNRNVSALCDSKIESKPIRSDSPGSIVVNEFFHTKKNCHKNRIWWILHRFTTLRFLWGEVSLQELLQLRRN